MSIQTKNWVIATNGKQLGNAVNPRNSGSWQGFVRSRDHDDIVFFRNGAGRFAWGGLQFRVDQASGATLLIREYHLDGTTGRVVGYRDFHSAPGLPGIQWLPPTVPADGTPVSWSQRFILDRHNWADTPNWLDPNEPVSNDAVWFQSRTEVRYGGWRGGDLGNGAEALIRKDFYGDTATEEYFLGRLSDGSTVGIYGWVAPEMGGNSLAQYVVEFTNPVTYLALMPWRGVWSDVWLWTQGTNAIWVPAPPKEAVIRVPAGSTPLPVPVPVPQPAPPQPDPAPVPSPSPTPGEPKERIIDRVEVERVMEAEAQQFLDNLRASLRAL